MNQRPPPPGIDASVPSPARIYDSLIGGKDNYAADRQVAARLMEINPNIQSSAIENRAFLGRAVRYLAEQGVDQFLDIGTGLPTRENVHQVAQAFHADARVLYVDYDPGVVAHARALLGKARNVAVLEADLRDPDTILDEARRTLDFDRPVAVLLIAVLHFIPDADDPHALVRRLRDALPPGSYVAVSHTTADLGAETGDTATAEYSRMSSAQAVHRDRAAITRFMDGLELVEPGVEFITRWRPAGAPRPPEHAVFYGAVGRKPLDTADG